MIYACDNCHFLFSRTNQPEQCPDCGKYAVRKATEAERQEYMERLGLSGEQALDVMNVKCSTITIGSLLSTKGFLPAYHMNKNHWISIVLDNSVPDDQITPLLELSYDSAAPKRRTKRSQPAEE